MKVLRHVPLFKTESVARFYDFMIRVLSLNMSLNQLIKRFN